VADIETRLSVGRVSMRDTLELADDGLFIERIMRTPSASDAELVIRSDKRLNDDFTFDNRI
jgi:hypothetical protein